MRKLLTIISLALCLNANAKYRQDVQVKYQKQYGWSKYYNVEAVFMTGHELNQATYSFDYNSFDTYCIIWWSREQCSIINVGTLMCGYNANSSCISFRNSLEGYDQSGEYWYVCLTYYCY